jgi:pimeloyl-ACP methyl ester carboxylesterase
MDCWTDTPGIEVEPVVLEEVEIEVRGRVLAGKRWGQQGATPVMALHGWLDNANSFDLIAPQLGDFDLFALDFAGHGRSDHRSADTPYLAILDVQDVIAAANQLQWERFTLLGHSMGAEVSTHIIGLYPDRVERLFAIDGFAETVSHEKWHQIFRQSVDTNLTKTAGALRVYSDQEELAQGVARFTGQTTASARILVERGTKAVDGGYSWVSDPRVRWSDALGITADDMDHIVGSFGGDILVAGANSGLEWYRSDLERLANRFANFSVVAIDGTHHVHMDEDTSELVQLIRSFIGFP